MKLLNINAAASYLMVSYSGPKLNGVKCSSLPLKSRSHFLATVIDALSHIFPKSGYLSINVDTGAGFILGLLQYNLYYLTNNFDHYKNLYFFIIKFKLFYKYYFIIRLS